MSQQQMTTITVLPTAVFYINAISVEGEMSVSIFNSNVVVLQSCRG